LVCANRRWEFVNNPPWITSEYLLVLSLLPTADMVIWAEAENDLCVATGHFGGTYRQTDRLSTSSVVENQP